MISLRHAGLEAFGLALALALVFSSARGENLSETYDLALRNDPTLRQSEATRDAVLESIPQSVARLLPNISVSAQMSKNYFNTGTTFIPGQEGFQNFWTSSATLQVTQPIYHHDYWVQLGQADNQVARAEAQYAAEHQNLIVRMARAYFDVLFAEDTLEFAHAERVAIERQLEQAKARFDEGLIAITDVHEAQAGFDLASANEIRAENELDNAREALREIIGQQERPLWRLSQEIPLSAPQPANLDDWNRRAQESNFDIIAAQNSADLAKKAIDLQFAGHLPTLDLIGQAGFSDTNRINGIRYDNQVVGMQVNVPLFTGGSVNSKVRQAEHELTAARDALDRQRRSVTRLTKDAYRGVLSSISQVKALKAAVTSAQSALEATEAGFEVGTRTMVDVLAEQRNLYRAQRDYAKARYDYIVSSLVLKQSASSLRREDVELVNNWLKP